MTENVLDQQTVTKEIQTAARHSAVYGLGSVLAKALGFLMLPFYTHYLNPKDYGTLEILDLSISVFGMFLNMGMTAALMRCFTAAKSADERQKAVSTAFMFVGATGFITFAVLLGFVRPVSLSLFGPSVPTSYLLISFSSFTLNYISNLPFTYLRALEASGSLVLVETISLFTMLALNVYFIAVMKVGLVGILWSSLLVAGIQAALLSWWTIRNVRFRFSAPLLRQMVAFGLPLVFSNLALFALNYSDRFFLQHLRSLEVVGIYAVGYKFGFMLNYLLVQPFFAMWQSRMYVIHAREDHPKIFGQIFMLYSLVLTYAGLSLSMLSPEIVHIMVGSQFALSQEVIPIVTLAYIFYGVGYFVQVGMFVSNKTHLIGIVSAAAAILNFGLNYFLILHYGMLGAAWATLVSFMAIGVGSYWFSQRVCPLPLGVGRATMAMLLGVVFYLLSRWWQTDSLWMSVLMKGLLLAAFPILLWKVRVISAPEIGTILATRDTAAAGVLRLLGQVFRKTVNT